MEGFAQLQGKVFRELFVKLGDVDMCTHAGLGPLLLKDKLVEYGPRLGPRFTVVEHAKVRMPFSLCPLSS